MSIDKEIAKIASLIGDNTRAAILIALMDGRALTAGELALHANISPQTASNHLNKLLSTQLILCESTGRHRYYKIASPNIANTLESLSLLTQTANQHPQPRKPDNEICFARSCYDHLAGELGVKITEILIERKYIELDGREFKVTPNGKLFFSTLDINSDSLITLRRQFAKPCLDWTERKHHLAGSLGAALLDYFMKKRLLMRFKQKKRALILTTEGKLWLKNTLGSFGLILK